MSALRIFLLALDWMELCVTASPESELTPLVKMRQRGIRTLGHQRGIAFTLRMPLATAVSRRA